MLNRYDSIYPSEKQIPIYYISTIKKLLLWGKLYEKIPNIGLTYVKSP